MLFGETLSHAAQLLTQQVLGWIVAWVKARLTRCTIQPLVYKTALRGFDWFAKSMAIFRAPFAVPVFTHTHTDIWLMTGGSL